MEQEETLVAVAEQEVLDNLQVMLEDLLLQPQEQEFQKLQLQQVQEVIQFQLEQVVQVQEVKQVLIQEVHQVV